MTSASKRAADAAKLNLRAIIETCENEGNPDAAALRWFADAANRYMATMAAAGLAPPYFIISNRVFLKDCGWLLPAAWQGEVRYPDGDLE